MNLYMFGFAGAAATALMGVDYYNQTVIAGQSGSPAAYAAHLKERLTGASSVLSDIAAEQERKARWKMGGQPYLPEAPEGWTRRALTEGDDSAIFGPLEDPAQIAQFLEQARAGTELKERGARVRSSWVYARGSETLFIEITLRDPLDWSGLTGPATGAARAAIEPEPRLGTVYGLNGRTEGAPAHDVGRFVIGGVAFTETLGQNGAPLNHFRVLTGRIGLDDGVEITVHANASATATREILSAIDFDGLNALLSRPLAHVSTAAATVHPPQEAGIATRLNQLHSLLEDLRAREAHDRLTGSQDMQRLLAQRATLAALPQADAQGVTDIPARIDQLYRSSAASMLAGDPQARLIDDLTQVIEAHDALIASRPAPEAPQPVTPTMSPELAAELGKVSASPATTSQMQPSQAALVTQAQPQAASKATTSPGRLQLSGGRSCLNGTGRFCD